MWGAVIGDIAGSIYEYAQYQSVSSIDIPHLFTGNSFYTDETILTIANYDAILNKGDYEFYLREYGRRYANLNIADEFVDHFPRVFSSKFEKWVNGKTKGKSNDNGAMARISGIGKMFDHLTDVRENAFLATIPSHNSTEAIQCATQIALIIFYARMGYSKNRIMNTLNIKRLEYNTFTSFNETCYETYGNCLMATFTSSNFEEAVKKVISMGGATSTNGCIVGAMAEALFGVPEWCVNKARELIPEKFSAILDKAYHIKEGYKK